MKKYSQEVRAALSEAADTIETLVKDKEALLSKVAAFERVEKSRDLLALMASKGLRSPDSVNDEEIRKLASSGVDLEQMREFTSHVAPQADMFSGTDNKPGATADPVTRRDVWVASGEDARE